MARKRFTDSPISDRQQQLSKQEEELRRQMEQLERQIAEAPKQAQDEIERRRQERIERAASRRSPFDAPNILQDHRHENDLFEARPIRPRRKQRRDARFRLATVFLAVIVTGAVVVFLAIQLMRHL
jgi:DNA-binding protein H-NS